MKNICFTAICVVLFASLAVVPMAGQPAATGGDCYMKESQGRILLGNSKIEIALDGATGAINGLRNKTSGVDYLAGGAAESFRLVYSTWELHGAAVKNPFGAAAGTTVYSSKQKIASRRFIPTPGGGRLELGYNQIQLDRRSLKIALNYTIELRDQDEETIWRVFLKNEDQGTVREIHFPLVSRPSKLDWLLLPNHSGQRISDPLGRLTDETPLMWVEYPGRGSMQWFEYYSPKAGLYLASYDKDLSYTQLCFGKFSGSDPALWIVKYPFAVSGDTWESPPLALGLHVGDWHWGGDRYRNWLSTWVPEPRVPKRIREMSGGQGGITIRGMDERLNTSYADIPQAARSLLPGAIFMLVGWMFNGHDTYYPEYVPMPDQGGAAALVKAIEQVHKDGRLVSAYVNGRLANNDTETYRKYGKRWAVLTIAPGTGVASLNFAELQEDWNDAWDKAKLGEGWFSVMCPHAKGWQDHLVAEAARIIRDYRFDGIFFDQPGSYYAELCYSKHHGHSNPATAWGPGYLTMIGRIRQAMRAVNPESFLWVEGMNDAYGQFLDYHMDKNPVWEPMRTHPEMETFVEMWRYAVPGAIIVNTAESYSFPPAKDRIYGENYKFVMGIRGISSRIGGRGAAPTDAERAARNAVIEKIQRLWARGGEFFFYGRFLDDIGLKLSNRNVLARVYLAGNGAAVPFWNSSAAPVSFDFSIDTRALGLPQDRPWEVSSLDTGAGIPAVVRSGVISGKLTTPAHDIDALVVRLRN